MNNTTDNSQKMIMKFLPFFPNGIRHKKIITVLSTGGAACFLAASQADAFTAPAAGTFAYDIFDIGVNQILKGPIGFAAGVGAMVAASVMAIRQMLLPAAATVLGGAFLLKADSVVSSLGALVG
jgi:hypothetical protein